jgi:dienelactone hydrolase
MNDAFIISHILSIMKSVIFAAIVTSIAAYELPTETKWADCDHAKDIEQGPFGPAEFFNITWDKTIFYGWIPKGKKGQQFPLLTFMHGSTGQWEMYNDNLELYASHGAVVIFPHIKSPEKDKNPLTTNTNGEFLLKSVEFATNATADPNSPLYGKVDTESVVYAGHSMGATCSIMASKRSSVKAKLTITQHPGICGPFGPPPSPDTWMPHDLSAVSIDHPVLFTTATNDGAFWPAPMTAKHELGCFNDSMIDGSVAAFAQFSAEACPNDHARDPFPDGGHNCPMRFADGGRPETWWVLTAFKLYAQLDGDRGSKCYSMLWGNDSDSLQQSPDIEKFVLKPAEPSASVFTQ